MCRCYSMGEQYTEYHVQKFKITGNNYSALTKCQTPFYALQSDLFIPHPMRQVLYLSPWYSLSNWGTQRLNPCPKAPSWDSKPGVEDRVFIVNIAYLKSLRFRSSNITLQLVSLLLMCQWSDDAQVIISNNKGRLSMVICSPIHSVSQLTLTHWQFHARHMKTKMRTHSSGCKNLSQLREQ